MLANSDKQIDFLFLFADGRTRDTIVFIMSSTKTTPVLDRLLAPLGECLTPETARRLLALKADATLQARVDSLAKRHSQGLLTSDEQAEYGKYVSYSTFVAILKSQARRLLAAPISEG